MDPKELPLFEAVLESPEHALEAVALVDKPAIERDFLALKAIEPTEQPKAVNAADPIRLKAHPNRKHVLTGPILLADTPIYRRAPATETRPEEFNVIFRTETITAALQMLMKRGPVFNLMHDSEAIPDGVYLFEAWQVDREAGKMPLKGFEDVPDGSLFGSVKVENLRLWNEAIETGMIRGFSIEGIFGLIEAPLPIKAAAQTEEEALEELAKVLDEILNDLEGK